MHECRGRDTCVHLCERKGLVCVCTTVGTWVKCAGVRRGPGIGPCVGGIAGGMGSCSCGDIGGVSEHRVNMRLGRGRRIAGCVGLQF